MTGSFGQDITEMLQAWRRGDKCALEKLTPQVYLELRKAAKRSLKRERNGHSIQTTALINELYLRLEDLQGVDWRSRAHFFAVCARQMRRILIDLARARQSHKPAAEHTSSLWMKCPKFRAIRNGTCLGWMRH